MHRIAGFISLAALLAIVSLGAPSPVLADQATATIRIGGTGTALGGMRLLAKAFSESHRDVHIIVLPSLGSGGGIKALAAGKIDVSVSARPLKETEREKGLKASEYARTPIIFATRYDTRAENLTLERATAMYAGEIRAWPDGKPVRLVLRPATESDIKLIRSFSRAMDRAVEAALKRSELHVAINDQDNATALEKIPGSLGVTTLAQIITEKRRIKPLEFDGVAGTAETLRSGKYRHAKQLFIILGSEPISAAEAFVRFVHSPEGRVVLTSSGHVVPDGGGKPDM